MAEEFLKFMIEDAELIYKNFAGRATKFKDEGTRTFSAVLDKDTADKMAADGWNVKCKLVDAETPEEFCFIEVTVGYKIRPPKIVCITQSGRTHLTEETVAMLDWADIRKVDFTARAYAWEVGNKTGIKAYLQTMFITIEEDELERKYANKSGSNA